MANTREKLETLPILALKEFAKEKKIKNYSTMRKADLIEKLAALAEEEEAAKKQEPQEVAVKRQEPEADHVQNQEPQEVGFGKTDSDTELAELRQNQTTYRNETAQARNVQSDSADNPRKPYEHRQRTYQRKESTRSDYGQRSYQRREEGANLSNSMPEEVQNIPEQDVCGILEVLVEGYGFIRSDNYLPGENDIYVAPSQIRRFNLKTGDIIKGKKRDKMATDKYAALMLIDQINGKNPAEVRLRTPFEKLTPIFPNQRLKLSENSDAIAMRVMDLVSPIGKGQRGMIVSQPKSGKTTLLKQVANSITKSHPEMHVIILLIDERPEEVTDIKESIMGDNVEVIYSTFDEQPDRHKRVSEMTIERAKRLAEQKEDVVILLDSITRLARAYNLTVQASGRTLSGGLDPAALYMPKRFFGAARNIREGGSLTILATALVETGSKMDDVVFEEFKGTGNMELVLDRKLSEKRIFPALDLAKSSTRREDLLLDSDEMACADIMRKALNSLKTEDAAERILDLFVKTKNNKEFVDLVNKRRYI